MSAVTNYNILIIGISGVGKSAWVRRMMTGEYVKRHLPTPKDNMTQFLRHTTRGIVQFVVRETTEPEVSDYICVDGVIVMIDVTDANSMDDAKKYLNNIPQPLLRSTVFVAHKVEAFNRPILPPQCMRLVKQYPGVQYCEVSSNSNYHLYKPIDLLLDPSIDTPCIIIQPAVEPPTVTV